MTEKLTKRHIKWLVWMLIGFYIRIALPADIYPVWLNLGIEIAGWFVFWASAYQLLK